MLTPEQIAEIKAADLHSLQADAQHNPDVWTLNEWRKQLLAEIERLTYQRDQAREATDRNDEFVNELCTLIPDDRDDDIGAEAIIIGWVKEVLARLKAAEDLCVMYSWSPARHITDRDKAAHELWSRWYGIVGSDFLTADAHPDLSDEMVALLAAQRDETRARTIARIRPDGNAELPGGEG